jgi:hypothetical protein
MIRGFGAFRLPADEPLPHFQDIYEGRTAVRFLSQGTEPPSARRDPRPWSPEGGMDLDVVDVGDGECLRSGAKHHGGTHPLRFNYRSARSTIPTSVSLRTESRMGSPAMAVHSPNLLPVPAGG